MVGVGGVSGGGWEQGGGLVDGQDGVQAAAAFDAVDLGRAPGAYGVDQVSDEGDVAGGGDSPGVCTCASGSAGLR